jgi:hypothetical protein
MPENDAPGRVVHELALAGFAGIFWLSGGVRPIFDDLVSMAIRAVAHDMLLCVSKMLADSRLPLRFKD